MRRPFKQTTDFFGSNFCRRLLAQYIPFSILIISLCFCSALMLRTNERAKEEENRKSVIIKCVIYMRCLGLCITVLFCVSAIC